MRLLIILLIAANCATYFWLQQTQARVSADYASSLPAYQGYPTIVMLTELSSELEAETVLSNTSANKSTNAPLNESDVEQIAEHAVAVIDHKAGQTEPLESEATSKQELLTETEVIELAKLQLQKPVLEEGDLCWFVDISSSQDQQLLDDRERQLGAISNYFSSLGVYSELVSVKVPRIQKHVIYLPARETAKQAVSDLKELLKDGYDAFVFRQGEFRNAISLGFYGNKTYAEEMLEKFRSQGLDAQLAPWKTFDIDPMLRLEDRELAEHWQDVEDQWQGARREKKYCNSVVQG